MSEVTGVQLVRCPKCENLLPEPSDFSVYQCGGCGAILRAKRKGLVDGGISDLSDEQKSRGESNRSGPEKTAGLGSDSRAERESNGAEPGKISERNHNENGLLNGNSSSATENKVASNNLDRGRRGTERLESKSDENRKFGSADVQNRHFLKSPNENIIQGSSNYGSTINRPAFIDSRYNGEFEEGRPLVSSLRSMPFVNHKIIDRNDVVDSHINTNTVAGRRGLVNFPYHDDGPSNYGRGAYYDYPYRSDGLARVETLEKDRADLLRKLDELANQLSRSFDVADKSKERSFHDLRIPAVSSDSYGRPGALLQEGAAIAHDVNRKPQAPPDKHVSRPPHHSYSHGYIPYADTLGSTTRESYPSRNLNNSQGYQGFADIYQPTMLRVPPHQLRHQHFQGSCYEQFPGYCANFNRDLFMPHPPEAFFHQPACSCLLCLNKNWHVPGDIQPPSLSGQNIGNKYVNRISHQHVNPVAYDPLGYNLEDPNLPQPLPRERHPLTRSSSDLGVAKGEFGHHHFKKVLTARGDGRVFHPIAGGAPFITCCTCSELLKLPRKLISTQKNQRTIKCGACSSILLFELKTKGIVVSVPTGTQQASLDIDASAGETPDENFQHSHSYSDMDAITGYKDYENFNYNFHLTDVEHNLSLREQMSNFDESEMRQDTHSSSFDSSENELSQETTNLRKDNSRSDEFLSKPEACLDSPSLQYSDHLSSDLGMNRNGLSNRSKRTDQDKSNQEGKPSRQNSLKDAMVATEMDVSYNDHSNTAVSHDFVEVPKVEDQGRINKGGQSFFVGLIKRSFGDLSRSSKNALNERYNVSVNGHLIPDRVVKKAEKLAGPIQPGEYWYDFQAGFWGAIGHPCLGIIPPNIEEFNYPISEDCAGGNTRVFVNGRELHQKDLDLLAGRGLPNTRHKHYLVEISGRVVDEETGKELDGLGKLAPTVERAKHGFGMRVPK